MKLNRVFVAGGVPETTYVGRESLGLERRLRAVLAEGHQIVALTGPTKSGKTVLCRRVLAGELQVWVDGGQVNTADDFWNLAAQKLKIPGEVSLTSADSSKGGVRYIAYIESGSTSATSEKYFYDAKTAVLDLCKEIGAVLVIDDFHYLDDVTQKEIIRNLKSEIFDGLSVIVIAVPHRAFDTIRNEKEMEGRFAHLEIPPWEDRELLEIPRLGFPALNVDFPPSLAAEFAKEAFGSPILMQRFCLRVCTEYEVFETLPAVRQLNPSDKKRHEIYASVAENYGFPTFKILADGPQSRTDRLPRRLKGGGETVDIYQALLRAIASTGPKDQISYDELREALRQVLHEADMPQKQQITTSLGYMSREARAKVEGEPPLEWRDEVIYITDPSLMFYLRWAFGNLHA